MEEAILIRREVLSREELREIVHIELCSDVKYETGDILYIYPENSNSLIEEMKKLYDYDFSEYDLRVPSKSLVKLLSGDREELKDLLKITNIGNFKKFIYSNTVPELLKGSSLTLEQIIPAIDKMRARAFSIASSNKSTKDIHLLFSLVGFETSKGIEYGTASEFLATCPIGKKMKIMLKRNEHFHLPDEKAPIIMIGNGTGLAPYIGFLQERTKDNWLIFGDRHRGKNLYYKDFLLNKESREELKLSLAFSRDSENKRYVQDEVIDNIKDIKAWIDRGAYIYICGSTAMAKEVERAFISSLDSDENVSKNIIKDLKKDKRYLMDVY